MLRGPYGFLFAAAGVTLLYMAFQASRNDGVIRRGDAAGPATNSTVSKTTPKRTNDTIRIAAFNLDQFHEKKISDPQVGEILLRILRQFDVIAVQEVTARSQDFFPALCELLNAKGARYDYVVGPRIGSAGRAEQFAFLYDRSTVDVDRNQLYTVEDRDDLVHYDPLVGWFRARGPKPQEAFTFSLVNVRVDPSDAVREINILDDVFFAVRSDGLDEDDVIMLGDFQSSDQKLGELGKIPHLLAVVAKQPTNVRGTAQLDNILFDQQSTTEFTGRGGIYDFLREFNLTSDQARLISDHVPVWAEFSVYEGSEPGRFAARPARTTR